MRSTPIFILPCFWQNVRAVYTTEWQFLKLKNYKFSFQRCYMVYKNFLVWNLPTLKANSVLIPFVKHKRWLWCVYKYGKQFNIVFYKFILSNMVKEQSDTFFSINFLRRGFVSWIWIELFLMPISKGLFKWLYHSGKLFLMPISKGLFKWLYHSGKFCNPQMYVHNG